MRALYRDKDYAWMDRGKCSGVPDKVMFPTTKANIARAKRICSMCEVREECLNFAMTPPLETWGIWGGLTERQRRRLRSSPASLPVTGTDSGGV